MTRDAERHLAKARDYVARGEEFYRKAAEEIVAAQQADAALTLREIDVRNEWTDGYAGKLARWAKSPYTETPTPFAEPQGAVAKRHARSVLRDPDEARALVQDPEVRQTLGRALDEHYTEKVEKRKQARHDQEVEERGGPDEHAAFERRQRIVEVINVARGLATGMRFVADEVKRLNLDEFEEAGSVGELLRCVEEVEGFATILRQFLSGAEVTDEDIAAFIGSGK